MIDGIFNAAGINRQLQRLAVLVTFYAGFTGAAAQDVSGLSSQEQAWIQAHPTVTVGNQADWPPFNFAVDGQPLGYGIDLVRLAATKVGLTLEFVTAPSEADLLAKLEKGRIDILPATYETADHRRFAAFTGGYLTEASVIVLRQENNDIRVFRDLSGKTLAVVRKAAHSGIVAAKFPDINLVRVETVGEGIATVASGKTDGMLGGVGALSHILQSRRVPDIKFIADPALRAVENPALHMAVPRDRTILRDILDKAIQGVTKSELAALHQTWVPLKVTPPTSQGWAADGFDRRMIPGAAIFLVLVIGAGIYFLKRKTVLS